MTTAASTESGTRPTGATVLPPNGAGGRVGRAGLAHLAVVATALGLWLLSLRQIDLDRMGTVGLLSVLPVLWWISLVVLAVGLAVAVGSRATRWRPAGLYLGGLLLVLYATTALIEDAPRYAYVYKHIGVTQYVAVHHGVDRSIDIYHRWPGFFSLTAWLDRVAGIGDPRSYAAWAELLFSAVWALLVFALAWSLTRDRRQTEIACGVVVTGNWIGQSYYSPQALSYTLTLAMFVLICRHLVAPPNRLGERMERGAARLTGRPVAGWKAASGRGSNGAAVLVLVLHAVVVATHQLSPYVTLISLALISAAGYLRPLWLPAAAAAVTGLYLLTNIGFVEHNYGIFSGLNPFANASTTLVDTADLSTGKFWVGRVAVALTFLIWLLGGAGVVRRLRQGHLRQAVLVGLLLVAPFLVLLGQSYGGEIRLRVFLFSLPWCAIGAAWLFTGRRETSSRVSTVALAGTSLLIVALFTVSNFGLEDVNAVRPGEVTAGDWVYQHGRPGAVLMFSGPGFPSRASADYNEFVNLAGESLPNLGAVEAFHHKSFLPSASEEDVQEAVKAMQTYAKTGYLVFSTTQYAYNRSYGVFPNGGMARLEQAIARSSRFRLVYGNLDARIYELGG